MKYRTLGKTGFEVSEIGLGTWALGTGIYGDVERDAPRRLIGRALDAGINFFDTAPLYGTPEEVGTAETILGEALADRRSPVLISTKFGRTSKAVTPGRFTAREAEASCEASLKRLGRDTIDVLFFHSPFSPEEIADDVWEALGRLRDAGKVRAIGHSVSLFEQTAAMSADWMRERRIEVIQVVLSPFNREARPLIETAIACDCGVVARECLANGFLSGTVTRDTVFPEGSLNARYSRGEIADRVDYAENLEREMVSGEVTTLPQAAYRWVLDQAGVSLALSGAKHPDELTDPVAASDLAEMPPAVLQRVEALHGKDFGAA
jgi:aryl-alcohol dehydrogenase-like predicted oxidoreductase